MLLAAVGAGDGFYPFILVDRVGCGGCGHRDHRTFASCPDFDKSYCVFNPHVLVGVFEEILLDFCIGQADAELIRCSLLPLITDLIAVGALFGESANFGLSLEAGCKRTDGLASFCSGPPEPL